MRMPIQAGEPCQGVVSSPPHLESQVVVIETLRVDLACQQSRYLARGGDALRIEQGRMQGKKGGDGGERDPRIERAKQWLPVVAQGAKAVACGVQGEQRYQYHRPDTIHCPAILVHL